jgi:hypothetical protein
MPEFNEIYKYLLRSKVNAQFSHYCAGSLYYRFRMDNYNYVVPIPTVPPEDLGVVTFNAEIKASMLARWIRKAIESETLVQLQMDSEDSEESEIKKIYWIGWEDEADSKPSQTFENRYHQNAYNQGRFDMRMGDDMPSVDARPWKETLKYIMAD